MNLDLDIWTIVRTEETSLQEVFKESSRSLQGISSEFLANLEDMFLL